MHLREIIIDEIRKNGPISFHDYMERCLYHPGYGYYCSAPSRTGPRGDFYTSPYLGSLFGRLLAKQLEEMWCVLGKNQFTIVEQGAGNAMLCQDILRGAKANPDFFNSIQYIIIEKNELPVPGNVIRLTDLSEAGQIQGCILSNELVDNFPIHRVVAGDPFREVYVDYKNGMFSEVLIPAVAKLPAYFTELGIALPTGYRSEVNLHANKWIAEAAQHLDKGFILTIDYGCSSRELYQERYVDGSLRCYYRHEINNRYYDHIGEQDITSHVNFSALQHWGAKSGLALSGFTSQSYFLLGLGLCSQALADPAGTSPALLRHLMVNIGTRMKVMIQQKNTPAVPLAGMRFRQRL